MPFVQVHWYEGRSDEQKAEIARRIEDALVEVAGVAPEHCWVKFSDSARPDLIIPEARD
ncbi:MAG: tautomerase family protein [Solirubrobacterales bacterium]|jgi:4-oxalocrotonate tautomerase family enzyme|nr:tautomerase family protein [Solirubrobacterales bacterium]